MISPLVIKRSNKRSLSLTINPKGDLVVKAPYQMSMDEIFSYINQHQKWIEDRQTKIKTLLQKNYQLINYEKLLFLGKQYEVCKSKGIEKPYLSNDVIIIPYTKSINSVKKHLKQFLIENCEDIILPRFTEISSKIKAKFCSVKIISSVAKWGMCDSKKNIYFNFKLLMMPHNIVDYVIIHELCHLKEFNHSQQFWKLVSSFMLDYKTAKAQLKSANFLIKLF